MISNYDEYKEMELINGYIWCLPSFNTEITNNCLIYSDEFGLISVGGLEGYGFSDNIYNLSFSNNAYREQNKWKWKRMDTKLKNRRSLTSCIMIKTNNNYQLKEKIIIIGGHHYKTLSSIEMYDFDDNNYYNGKCEELSSLNTARRKCGVCYSNQFQRIYIGGGAGFGVTEQFEYYDLIKNQCYSFDIKTQYEYDNYPVLWINNNMLCIGSTNTQHIECMDLREDKMKAILSKNKKNKLLNLQKLLLPYNKSFVENEVYNNCRLLR